MTELLAHAKLTWNLEITGVREDGFHELRSEMTTIALHDVLFVEDNADHLEILNPFTTAVATDESNLIVRALRLVGRRAGVRVEKSIPVGGGLGGGSADAAAILRWAGGVSNERAVTIGGDVPFCQFGGHALVEGVGERLSPLPYEERPLTLVVPDFAPMAGHRRATIIWRSRPAGSSRVWLARWRGCAPRSVPRCSWPDQALRCSSRVTCVRWGVAGT
jgi:4-diphosphocytidyl-2-C-methyl-D-erythritol kinase